MAWLLSKRHGPASTATVDTSSGASDGDVEKRTQSPASGGDGTVKEDDGYVDPQLEKRVLRKIDWNLMPLITVLYMLAFLDRSNIGNARIAGMDKALNLYGNRYQWFSTIFYISYILSEPTVVLFKVFKPRYWMAFLVFSWGVVATTQSATQSWAGEMVLRFLLGIFEAGYGPGTVYLLSFFYLRNEIGFRAGLYLAAAPLATTFAGALAYGITSGHAAIENWRLLFLVEGLPTICMVPFVLLFLPDSPSEARFLTEDEKKIARARTVRQNGTAERRGGLSWKETWTCLLDVKAWLASLMYFSGNVSFSSLPVFLPTVIAEMGFGRVQAQGLSAPPYFLAVLLTLLSAWIADRTQQRGYTIMVVSTIAGIGYTILATAKTVGVRYFAVYLATGGVFPAIANILPWTFNSQGSDTRRGVAVVLLNLIGQCGPLLGTAVYPDPDGPFYVKGQAVCAAFMFFTAVLALAMRLVCVRENRRLDEKYGAVGSGADGAGSENYGPRFRYVL